MKKNFHRQLRPPGFALIVTLSLMVLLTVIAVGLLSLASISLRSSAQGEALQAARANAKLAMMMALGQLQKDLGPDTRVSARADILSAVNPPVLGVWKSWEGSDHETTGNAQGRPISPGNYRTAKEARFQNWLVSGDPLVLGKSENVPKTTKNNLTAVLVGENSVGKGPGRDELQVHLPPVFINRPGKVGAVAWWVGGENQKARFPNIGTSAASGKADWASRVKSDTIANPKIFGLEALFDADQREAAAKTVSLKQVELISRTSAIDYYHDLSAVSVGLLTNTATGGWRKDLSLFTENYDRLPASGLPLFRLKPDVDLLSSIPLGVASNFRAAKSMLYPWSEYRGTAADIPIYQHGAVSGWENLKDYALLYRKFGNTSSFQLPASSYSISDNTTAGNYNYLHKVRLLPVIARIQWVFSHSAGPPTIAPENPVPPPGSLEPRLLVTPVITMWNPYNVTITPAAGFEFRMSRPFPCALNYTINGMQNTKYHTIFKNSTSYPDTLSNSDLLVYQIKNAASLALGPGETKVFSPKSTSPVTAATPIEMDSGYRNKGGHYFTVKKDSGETFAVPSSSSMSADAKFDNSFVDIGPPGVGISLDMVLLDGNNKRHLVYRMIYPPEVARLAYPTLGKLAEATSLAPLQMNPMPFLSTMFGARMASNTHIPAKGFLQSSPLVNFTAMGGKDVTEPTIARHYGGTGHPVNSPFDYSFVAHTGFDSYLPNTTGTTGYIATGFTSGNGLSRCIAAEIPTRPLASLAELQHWDLRYENPIPPYSFNIIGNSDATPLLPDSAVVNSSDAGLATNLQHDDSYCANHLLFDDWFFSSIAAGNASGFGTGGGNALKKTFGDFVTGALPLTNRAYQPLAVDTGFATASAANVDSLHARYIDKPDSWKSIASRLEVEGMFNVNSTSVNAWRALLGHARKQKIPYHDSGGSISLSGETNHAVSRLSIAGDTKAGSEGSSGFSGSSEFTGYRELDETLIDEFAKKIVAQIRLRGPFLSLSEFVNRQLSGDEDLALAGTIQAALNELGKTSSTNLHSGIIANLDIQDPSKKFASATPAGASSAEYKFPKAAEGICVYGIPGWTRQADVLRPLAPILSARDDTFTIRAYGDSRDSANVIKAKVVCEVVVRRTREYCDPTEAADISAPVSSPLNKTFGRRFEIVSFRWLSTSEI